MKIVKCPYCKRESKIEENVIMAVCKNCQIEMEEIEDERIKKIQRN